MPEYGRSRPVPTGSLAVVALGFPTEARIVEEEGNPRFPTVASDGEGQLWIAFFHDEGGDRKIVRRLLNR